LTYIFRHPSTRPKTDPASQLINITVGALVAAFSTGVNFWLGSSQGSRAKDDANFQLQAQQAAQVDDARKVQHELNKDVVNNVRTEKKAPPVVAGGVARTEAVTGKDDNFEACVKSCCKREAIATFGEIGVGRQTLV
jgi:hypothetical protein